MTNEGDARPRDIDRPGSRPRRVDLPALTIADFLATTSLFAGCDRATILKVAPHVFPVEVPEGTVIVRAGAPNPGIGVVYSGRATVRDGTGTLEEVAVRGAFGESGAFLGTVQPYEVAAAEDSVMLLLSHDIVTQLATKIAAFSFAAARRLAARSVTGPIPLRRIAYHDDDVNRVQEPEPVDVKRKDDEAPTRSPPSYSSPLTRHTILFLAANPLGTDRLGLDKEARAIQVELERSGFRDSFELVTRWAAEPLDLLRELRKFKPTVVHFGGHGTADGADARGAAEGPHRDVVVENGAVEPAPHGLYFQGPDGRPQLVSAEALAQVFGAASTSVKLVILSACYSDPRAAALAAYVDCVVGMRSSIGDAPARSFAIGFYGGLGERESVAAAFRQGCAAVGLEGLSDGDKPRLRVRDGVDAELVVLADRASGDPAARSRGLRSSPIPAYANAEVQTMSKRLEDARARKKALHDAGVATDQVDREILEIRRKLREGGQLRAGDAVGDGRYLLIRIIGRGGFAVVWEAHDIVRERSVAVKVLHQHLAGESQRRERFFRGARVMMELEHPAVVRVYDPRGEDEAFCYFVMELMRGGNLRDAVLGPRIDAWRCLPLLLQVTDALAEAHGKQLVHRDVKPTNILLDEHGNAKLTDFDLVGAHDTTGGTRTGALGTVVYAAPECLDKPQEATARADVFGLGMTAIFCLSGQDLSMTTFRNPAATVARLDCSVSIRNVLELAVAWEPEVRFADAAAMLDALHGAMGGARRPRWAVASVEDRYGLWAAFEINGVQQRMRRIPPGTFRMGSSTNVPGRLDEVPQHDVTLTRGYWLGETPVTQALWIAVMGENPSHFRGDRPEDLQRPVENVSWEDCQVFLDRLNVRVPGLAARLPTEAEWERACRAATTSATWSGDPLAMQRAPELGAIAWYADNSGSETHPVGGKAPNPYGLYDMLGNVWEWCADEQRAYKAEPATDPAGTQQGPNRISRGGSWEDGAMNVRAEYSYAIARSFRFVNLGFRLVAGPESALR